MIKGIRTGLVFAGTLAVLIVGVAPFSHFANLDPTTDLKSTFLPWRLGFYALVLIAWKPISRFLCRPRLHPEDRTEAMLKQWDELSQLLAKSWWKLALFFAVFEIFIIQKVGFGA